MFRKTTGRPTLDAWLAEYRAIEEEFVCARESEGVAFEPYGVGLTRVVDLRRMLRERGARFMNGGASISSGFLSSACEACVGDCGSRTFYINLRCNRDCYFCFNPNQIDFEEHCLRDTPWREDLEAFARSGVAVTHIGLTGGEPLLVRDEALAFFRCARELCPDAHLRLYTSGLGLDEAFCREAAACGLDEIRFSVKLDEGESSVAKTLAGIRIARRCIPDVMVEMPVAPDEGERMERLLVELDEAGVRGVNLLEFCYPFRNWNEFSRRGYRVKNPPFEVLYEYGYAGGLPIAGSEEACLELVLFALDEGLRIGVQYCSLDNKNRDQVLQANRSVALDPALYELGGDCFYHAAKAFDGDVGVARRVLSERHAFFTEDDEGCVTFHPRFAAEVAAAGVAVAHSWNIVERQSGAAVVRELKLALWDEEGVGRPWSARLS
ncbi:radical SAM protein [Rubneribacter sp.]|nr:radical SAM protein [Candidatus Rubneribacter avistercoris]